MATGYTGVGRRIVRNLDDKSTSYWYHNTVVARATADSIQLNNGGYYTATTKRAINQAMTLEGYSISIVQIKGEWFAVGGKNSKLMFNNGMVISHGK